MTTAIKISPDWQQKGELLMEGLVEEIGMLWAVCQRVEGVVVPGGQLGIPDVNQVLNALRRVLSTIRSLDVEVLKNSDPAGYARFLKDPESAVLRGLIGPRNNAVHHPEVIEVNVSRAVGQGVRAPYVIFPGWKSRSDLPNSVFTTQHGFKQNYASAYEQAVGGRGLFDPLLDAFKVLDSVSGLAKRDAAGELVGFPLPPLPVAAPNTYTRLHPDWPTLEEWEARFRRDLVDNPPKGDEREVQGFFRTSSGSAILVGTTGVTPFHRHSFLEELAQVARDVSMGYEYRTPDGARILSDLTVNYSGWRRYVPFLARKDLLAHAGLEEFTNDPALVWQRRWDLCVEDVGYYASFRRPR